MLENKCFLLELEQRPLKARNRVRANRLRVLSVEPPGTSPKVVAHTGALVRRKGRFGLEGLGPASFGAGVGQRLGSEGFLREPRQAGG